MEPTAAGYRPGALDAATVAEAFRITADERPDAVALDSSPRAAASSGPGASCASASTRSPRACRAWVSRAATASRCC